MNKLPPALLITAALGLAGTAQADLIWDWTLTAGDTGSGTFTTTDYTTPTANPYYPGHPGYLVTGATGTFDGATVTGVVAPAIAFTGTQGGWDQLLLTGGLVDSFGVVLTINNVNNAYAGVFFNSSGIPNGVKSGEFNDLDTFGINDSILTVSLVTAPEPSQVVSMLPLAGLGGVVLLGKLRRRK